VGNAYAVLSFMLWGVSSTVLLRHVPLFGPAATQLGAMLSALALLTLGGTDCRREALALWRGRTRDVLLLALASALTSMLYHWSVKTTTVANATLLHAMHPLSSCLLFIPLWFGRKPGSAGHAALALGVAGMLALTWQQLAFDGLQFGMALALLSAVAYSWGAALVPRFPHVDAKGLLLATLTGSAVLLSPAWLFAEWPDWTAPSAGAMLAFGLSNFIIANLLWIAAVRSIPLTRLAILGYLEPVIGVTAGALFLGEPLSGGVLLGGGLILSASALVLFAPNAAK